jgi:hypothetical protein
MWSIWSLQAVAGVLLAVEVLEVYLQDSQV